MPQVFQVLRCFKCLVFQVHQTKKSNKWECKLCGEKQSIKRHYGIGTGKDCRIHVQKLNCIRGEIDELKCSKMVRNQVSDEETELEDLQPVKTSTTVEKVRNSKWSTYVEDPEPEQVNNEPMCLGDTEIVLEIPKKRRKQTVKPKNNVKDVLRESLKSECNENSNTSIKSYDTTNNNVNNARPYTSQSTSVINSDKIIPKISAIVSDTENIENKNFKVITQTKFVPAAINKHSKWAQYADDEFLDVPSSSVTKLQGKDECIGTNTELKPECMFSLCDDTELDSVLDII